MAGYYKQLLSGDKVLKVFVSGRLLHPVALQMFGIAGGYDGFWLDLEHGGLSTEQITTAALVGKAYGWGTFVRMPLINYSIVTQALESGADGVMAAQVFSVEEAETFVRWAKFPPRGMRGLNNAGADGAFTHKSPGQFAADANRDHFVAIQIETMGALEQVDQIAALDGVDLLFVGPFDLSAALGVLGQTNHEKVWEAIERVAKACKAHGKTWGIVPAGGDYAKRCVDLGCRMLTCGSDVMAMKLGVQALKDIYRL